MIGAGMGALAMFSMARDDIKWYMDRQARKRAARNLWEHQKRVLKNQLQWRARDATDAMQKTGIHRLALLGVSPADAGSSIPVGQYMGDSGASGDLIRALASTATKEEKDLMKANIDLKKETLKGLEIENQKAKLDLARQKSTGLVDKTGDPLIDDLNAQGQINAGNPSIFNSGSGTGGNSPIIVEPKTIKPFGGLGIEDGMEAFEKLKIDWEGFVYVVPADSQDIEENAFIKGIYYPRKAKGWALGTVKKFQRILEQVKPAPPGYIYVFRRAVGQFQLISEKQFQQEMTKRSKETFRKAYSRQVGRRRSTFTPF